MFHSVYSATMKAVVRATVVVLVICSSLETSIGYPADRESERYNPQQQLENQNGVNGYAAQNVRPNTFYLNGDEFKGKAYNYANSEVSQYQQHVAPLPADNAGQGTNIRPIDKNSLTQFNGQVQPNDYRSQNKNYASEVQAPNAPTEVEMNTFHADANLDVVGNGYMQPANGQESNSYYKAQPQVAVDDARNSPIDYVPPNLPKKESFPPYAPPSHVDTETYEEQNGNLANQQIPFHDFARPAEFPSESGGENILPLNKEDKSARMNFNPTVQNDNLLPDPIDMQGRFPPAVPQGDFHQTGLNSNMQDSLHVSGTLNGNQPVEPQEYLGDIQGQFPQAVPQSNMDPVPGRGNEQDPHNASRIQNYSQQLLPYQEDRTDNENHYLDTQNNLDSYGANGNEQNRFHDTIGLETVSDVLHPDLQPNLPEKSQPNSVFPDPTLNPQRQHPELSDPFAKQQAFNPSQENLTNEPNGLRADLNHQEQYPNLDSLGIQQQPGLDALTSPAPIEYIKGTDFNPTRSIVEKDLPPMPAVQPDDQYNIDQLNAEQRLELEIQSRSYQNGNERETGNLNQHGQAPGDLRDGIHNVDDNTKTAPQHSIGFRGMREQQQSDNETANLYPNTNYVNEQEMEGNPNLDVTAGSKDSVEQIQSENHDEEDPNRLYDAENQINQHVDISARIVPRGQLGEPQEVFTIEENVNPPHSFVAKQEHFPSQSEQNLKNGDVGSLKQEYPPEMLSGTNTGDEPRDNYPVDIDTAHFSETKDDEHRTGAVQWHDKTQLNTFALEQNSVALNQGNQTNSPIVHSLQNQHYRVVPQELGDDPPITGFHKDPSESEQVGQDDGEIINENAAFQPVNGAPELRERINNGILSQDNSVNRVNSNTANDNIEPFVEDDNVTAADEENVGNVNTTDSENEWIEHPANRNSNVKLAHSYDEIPNKDDDEIHPQPGFVRHVGTANPENELLPYSNSNHNPTDEVNDAEENPTSDTGGDIEQDVDGNGATDSTTQTQSDFDVDKDSVVENHVPRFYGDHGHDFENKLAAQDAGAGDHTTPADDFPRDDLRKEYFKGTETNKDENDGRGFENEAYTEGLRASLSQEFYQHGFDENHIINAEVTEESKIEEITKGWHPHQIEESQKDVATQPYRRMDDRVEEQRTTDSDKSFLDGLADTTVSDVPWEDVTEEKPDGKAHLNFERREELLKHNERKSNIATEKEVFIETTPTNTIMPMLTLLFVVIIVLILCSKMPSFLYSTWISFGGKNGQFPFFRRWSRKGYTVLRIGDKTV